MKKNIIILILLFISINIFSIETFKIEKGRFKSNSTNYTSVVKPFVWQPWQKMNANVTLDRDKKKIITYFDNIKKYTYFKEEHNNSSIFHITIYYTKGNFIFRFYDNGKDKYLKIDDINNKIEMYYKINN